MAWVFIPKDIQSLFEFRLLYLAMSGKVAACRVMFDKIVLRKETLRASVVNGGQVNIKNKKSIIGFV